VTHLLINEVEGEELSGISAEDLKDINGWKEGAKYSLSAVVKNVVITLGVKGAYYATNKEDGFVNAVPNVVVKDATGAGLVLFS
jgi:ribokinase